MGAAGTNNGGGPRWADMERGTCPRCGLTRAVGVFQMRDRGGECNNRGRCDARIAAKKAREKRDKLKQKGK